MMTRERIREKLLDVPHNGSSDIAGVTVECTKGVFNLMFPDGTIHEGYTMNAATSSIYISQSKPAV